MRISFNKFNNQNFQAHYYKVHPAFRTIDVFVEKDSTSGERPEFVAYDGKSKYSVEMDKEEDFGYSKRLLLPTRVNKIVYKLNYKDPEFINSKNGRNYKIPVNYLFMNAAVESRKQHGLPIVNAIKAGKTVGKIKFQNDISYDTVKNINEPTILVAKNCLRGFFNPNVVGIIYVGYDDGALSHLSSNLRRDMNISGAVFEPKTVNLLKRLNGKNVEIELDENKILVRETDKKGQPRTYPKIAVPKLESCDKILTVDEYSPKLVGAKAFNIAKLTKLANEGKIDVKIPNSIALPPAWIQRLFDENIEQAEKYLKHKDYYACKESAYAPYEERFAPLMETLRQVMKENGLDSEYIMFRSAFNGEDLPNYSAAGLYKSYMLSNSEIQKNKALYELICTLAQYKWNSEPVLSRERYKIPEEDIQPTILLQNYVRPDYKFTLYSDYNNKVRVELYSDNLWKFGDGANMPHVFEYDKKTKELNYKSFQQSDDWAIYDEKLNLKELSPIETDLRKSPEVIELVAKLVDNALVIEKEFGAPQDIEGGFKDNEIYLWQTRNIV